MSYSRQIEVFISRNLSPQKQSQVLASFARAEVARLQAEGRASLSYNVFVDGRENVPLETVRPDGRIFYIFSGLSEAISFALGYCIARSPRGGPRSKSPGTYRRSWFVLVNGRVWNADFRDIPGDAEVMIVNTQPYHRKLEMTRGGTKATVTYLCVQEIKKRFRRLYANHDFLELPGGPAPAPYRLKGGFVSRPVTFNERKRIVKTGKPKFSNKGEAMTYPAVILRAR